MCTNVLQILWKKIVPLDLRMHWLYFCGQRAKLTDLLNKYSVITEELLHYLWKNVKKKCRTGESRWINFIPKRSTWLILYSTGQKFGQYCTLQYSAKMPYQALLNTIISWTKEKVCIYLLHCWVEDVWGLRSINSLQQHPHWKHCRPQQWFCWDRASGNRSLDATFFFFNTCVMFSKSAFMLDSCNMKVD